MRQMIGPSAPAREEPETLVKILGPVFSNSSKASKRLPAPLEGSRDPMNQIAGD
jgi:hypothetical protein